MLPLAKRLTTNATTTGQNTPPTWPEVFIVALMMAECLPPRSIHKQIARAYIDTGCIRVQDGQTGLNIERQCRRGLQLSPAVKLIGNDSNCHFAGAFASKTSLPP